MSGTRATRAHTFTVNNEAAERERKASRHSPLGFRLLLTHFYSRARATMILNHGSSQTMNYTIILQHWSRIETARARDFT